MYEYLCPAGHMHEEIRAYEIRDRARRCHCGRMAEYIVSSCHIDYYHMGVDVKGNPTAAEKWANMHDQKLKQEQAS